MVASICLRKPAFRFCRSLFGDGCHGRRFLLVRAVRIATRLLSALRTAHHLSIRLLAAKYAPPTAGSRCSPLCVQSRAVQQVLHMKKSHLGCASSSAQTAQWRGGRKACACPGPSCICEAASSVGHECQRARHMGHLIPIGSPSPSSCLRSAAYPSLAILARHAVCRACLQCRLCTTVATCAGSSMSSVRAREQTMQSSSPVLASRSPIRHAEH